MVPLASAGNGIDAATDVKIASDGAVYVAGYMATAGNGEDASLMKIVNGAPAWAQPSTYDSPYHGDDIAYELALGPGGVVYTAGSSVGANGKTDVLLLKWSKAGKLLWARRYDGPAHSDDRAHGLGVDKAGNVTVAAGSIGAGGNPDYAVISWSSSGTQRWTWRYDGPFHGQDIPFDMLVAADGSIYVTGGERTVGDEGGGIDGRLSSKGKKMWMQAYAGPADTFAVAYAIAARPGGGVYIAGWTGRRRRRAADGLVVAYTPTGQRTVFTPDSGGGGATTQLFKDLAVASTGQVVAVGMDNGHPRQVAYTVDGTIAERLHLAQRRL